MIYKDTLDNFQGCLFYALLTRLNYFRGSLSIPKTDFIKILPDFHIKSDT